jgi:dihydroflavonol-4-reductase
MKTLVIGASGHLGAHLIRQLNAAGHDVRALVRPSSDVRALNGVNAEIVHGDVQDIESLGSAMEGREEVYHLAAPTGRSSDAYRVIVLGTRNVLETCRDSSVRRLVYTSSIVTVGYSPSPRVILDEDTNHRADASEYHSAKWEAEREVMAFAARESLPIVVVNPATVVGALDYRVTPSNAPIQRCLDHGLRWAVPGGLTIVHAEDAARGLMLAMQHGRPAERYILGGDRLSIPDYFALIATQCGQPGPRLTVPRPVTIGAAAIFSAMELVGSRPMPFSLSQAWHLVGKYGWYSSDKAVEELGYAWRPASEAVLDYIRWTRAGRPPRWPRRVPLGAEAGE